MNIDYTPLSAPVTAADIQRLKDNGKIKNYVRSTDGMIIAAFFLGSIFITVIALFNAEFGAVFWGASFTALLYFIFKGAYKYKNQTAVRMDNFIQRNELTLIEDAPSTGYKGSLFSVGGPSSVQEALVFPDGTEVGVMTKSVTVAGKNAMVELGYAKVTLLRKLPNILLDARANNAMSFGTLSTLFEGLRRQDKLKLEGDFNNHFTLYAPAQYHTDALYVFTPDVMAALIDAGKNYDIEIVDDELYVYADSNTDLSRPEQLQPFLKVVEAIAPELRDQTKRYTLPQPAGAEVSQPTNVELKRERKLFKPVSTFVLVIQIAIFAGFALNFYVFYRVLGLDKINLIDELMSFFG